MTACPNCVNGNCDALVSAELLALASAKVERAVTGYQRKLAGQSAFTDFAAMLPDDLREERAA